MAARKDGKQGHKAEKLWRDALVRAVKRRVEGKGSPQRLELIADRCVDGALGGDMQATKEIGDRLDGKAHQSMDLEVATPITSILRKIIDPATEAAEDAMAAPAASNGTGKPADSAG